MGGVVRTLLEDSSGNLWAGSSGNGVGGLVRLSSGAITRFGVLEGLPDSGVTSLFEDRQSVLWVGTRRGIYRWSSGQFVPFPTGLAQEIYSIADDAEGRLVVATNGAIAVLRLTDGRPEAALPFAPEKGLSVRAMLRDRDGTLWLGTFNNGLLRFANGRVDRYTPKDGLSGSSVQALIEDREGNLWIGTRKGIDRLRDSKITRFSAAEGLSGDLVTAVCAGRDDVTWVGTAGNGLNRIHDGVVTHVKRGLPSPHILSLYQGQQGVLWVGTTGGLAVSKGEGFVPVLGRDRNPLDRVTAITGGPGGYVWVADARKGIFRISGGTVEPLVAKGLSASDTDVYALLLDHEGRLWIGYYRGILAMVSDSKATIFNSSSGSFPGPVLSLYEDPSGFLLVGGSRGLGRYRNGQWTLWGSEHGLPPTGVQDLIEDQVGGIWLTTSKGLLRADIDDLRRQPDGAPAPIQFESFTFADGVRARTDVIQTQPRVARSPNGTLWFSSEEGVASIDPALLPKDTLPPPVIIESLKADRLQIDLDSSPEHVHAFRARELQFEFTALSLTAPATIRFRYRLHGYDPSWVEAGTRRQAFYTNLPPGRYRFSVIACDHQGVWTESQASLTLELLPPFYRQSWFQVLCAAIGCGIVWAVYRLRRAQIAREFESRLQARLGERNRIARELHDTLLQNVVGISLQLEVISKRLPETNAEKPNLERVRRQVDLSLREARESVVALRSRSLENRDLITSLREVGASLTAGKTIRFQVGSEGAPRKCKPELEEQLLRIGREAIGNAVAHSRCSEIQVQFSCTTRTICLRVSDNGIGIDSGLLATGLPGHFGLRGMRERAESIGGVLAVTSNNGAGTLIAVTAPLHKSFFHSLPLLQQIRATALRRFGHRLFRPAINAAGGSGQSGRETP